MLWFPSWSLSPNTHISSLTIRILFPSNSVTIIEMGLIQVNISARSKPLARPTPPSSIHHNPPLPKTSPPFFFLVLYFTDNSNTLRTRLTRYNQAAQVTGTEYSILLFFLPIKLVTYCSNFAQTPRAVGGRPWRLVAMLSPKILFRCQYLKRNRF
ncbi:hypothetical protein VTI74DRAFT_1991 [Chaetomium olivicolor]